MKTKAHTKLMARIDEITRNPEQPRTRFDAAALTALGKSLARRQQQPLTVIAFTDPKRPQVKWMINDGERRFRAAQKAGLEELWIVVDDVERGDELHTASFAANWNRAGHTHAETARAIDRERMSGKTYEEIATIVGKTVTWASAEHSLLQLDPALLKLMDPPTPKEDRLPCKHAYALARYPREKQAGIWDKYKHKPARESFHHIRIRATTAAQTVRRTGDDARYIKRRVAMAAGICKSIAALPRAMMQALSAAQRDEVARELRALTKQASALAALIDPSTHEEDDE